MTLLHINRPRGHYIGQVRPAGYQRWRTVTGKHKSALTALAAAVLRGRNMKRARVLFIDASGWYDPHVAAIATLD